MSIYVQVLDLVKLHYSSFLTLTLFDCLIFFLSVRLRHTYASLPGKGKSTNCKCVYSLRCCDQCAYTEAQKNTLIHTHIHRMLSKPTQSHWDKPCRLTAWQLVNVVWLLWEQRLHCRNSRLHAINPIPAITFSNIYCISRSVVKETHEELDKGLNPPLGGGLLIVKAEASGAGEKSGFSLLDHSGLYHVWTHNNPSGT